MRKCNKCGHTLLYTDILYCSECGSPIPFNKKVLYKLLKKICKECNKDCTLLGCKTYQDIQGIITYLDYLERKNKND